MLNGPTPSVEDSGSSLNSTEQPRDAIVSPGNSSGVGSGFTVTAGQPRVEWPKAMKLKRTQRHWTSQILTVAITTQAAPRVGIAILNKTPTYPAERTEITLVKNNVAQQPAKLSVTAYRVSGANATHAGGPTADPERRRRGYQRKPTEFTKNYPLRSRRARQSELRTSSHPRGEWFNRVSFLILIVIISYHIILTYEV